MTTRANIELARRLHELGDEHPQTSTAVLYRLAAAHLINAPGNEIRGLNRAYITGIDERFLLEILIEQLTDPEPSYPSGKEAVPFVREALRVLNEKPW